MAKLLSRIRNSPGIFALVLISLAGVFAFSGLASEVLEGESHKLDTQILMMFRAGGDGNAPIGPGWVQESMRDLTALGGVTLLTIITLGVFLYMLIIRRPLEAFYVLAAIASGLTISFLLKHGFDRPRPDLWAHGSITYTASFPSGHSMMSALVYFTLATLLAEVDTRKRARSFMFFCAAFITVCVGISRLYLGVHWPSDVAAGWLAGATWALMSWLVYHQFRKAIRRRAAGSGL